jgi:hypothetical protein
VIRRLSALAVPALLASPLAARAECDAKTLASLVATADTAFTSMDAEVFEGTTAELDRTLACQTEPLSAIQIAEYHRVRALAAFFAEDRPAAVLSFQAALSTMPGYALPYVIAPEGHPLRKLYEDAKLFAPGESFTLPEPADGWLTVDGTRTREAPAARPFVFQWLGSTGQVRETQYVDVGTPVPTYALAPLPPVVDLDPIGDEPPVPVKRKVSAPLVSAGLVLGAASAGMYGAAFVFRDSYDEAVLAGDEARIRSGYLATNGMLGGSAGMAVLGTTLLLVGVF